MEIKATEYLTWQRSRDAENTTACPESLTQFFPAWFKDLRGNLREYTQEFGYRTARHCLGLRGLPGIGYTLPFYNDRLIENYYRMFDLHPEQLHGTPWAEKINDQYVWSIFVISFPWRAKMHKHWKLMINDYPLDWSNQWHCFSGAVTPNYEITGNNIGSMWNYDYAVDIDFNYYNLEMVLAVQSGDLGQIPLGTPIFQAIPVYDPEFQN
jgi:hypothetical protein